MSNGRTKITIDQLIKKPFATHSQDGGWCVEVKGVEVSVIKWKSNYYAEAPYEIWSREVLFRDVERFPNMMEVLIRLTELENSNENK